jgi:sigma-B regulation protein RsbU (phosphoserine phosphatase)
MRILIAEDDLVSRRVLEGTLKGWGHDVLSTCDGLAAWQALQREDAPLLAILDWMMPGLDGLEVCRKVRTLPGGESRYLLLLTARDRKEDVVAGLEGGVNDYVTKPFDREELRARVQVGFQMVELQRRLAQRVQELEKALDRVRLLQGLLPICCYCKKIRNEHNYWQQVEAYISKHADVRFSHGICPECWNLEVAPQLSREGITTHDS